MWNGVVTNAGLSLLEMWAVGGETLYIDRATAGTGTVAQDNMRSSTYVQGDVGAVPIVASIPVSSGTQYRIQVQPSQSASYILRQLGIWAHLGDNGASTLLALYQDEDGVSVPLEADDPGFNFTLYAIVTMSNQGSISVNYDTSAYVTRDALAEVTSGMIKTVRFGGQTYTGDYAGAISIPVDAQPTENSNNTVKSGGVYDAVATKVSKAGDTMTGSLLIEAIPRYPSFSIVKEGTNRALLSMMIDSNNDARWFRVRNNTTTYTNDYYLPQKPTDDDDSYSYNILTTKDAVTVPQGGTGATTAAAARTNLEITPENIGAAKIDSVGGNPNANDFTTSGLYYLGTTATNVPSGTNGFLIVIANNSGTNVKQIFSRMGIVGSSDYPTYFRTLSGGTWGEWYQIINSKGGHIISSPLYWDDENGPRCRFQTSSGRALIQAYITGGDSSNGYNNYKFPQPLGDNKAYDILTTQTFDPYYAAGDTFSTKTSASYRPVWNGVVASDSKNIYINVITDRLLNNVSSVTVTTLTGWIYGIGGAIESSTTSTNWVTGYTCTAVIAANNVVRIRIQKSDSTAFAGVTASTPLVASLNTVLTFS